MKNEKWNLFLEKRSGKLKFEHFKIEILVLKIELKNDIWRFEIRHWKMKFEFWKLNSILEIEIRDWKMKFEVLKIESNKAH